MRLHAAQQIETAKQIYGRTRDLGQFFVEFSKAFKLLWFEDDAIAVVYPRRFYQHIVDAALEDVPDEYYECSCSWLRSLFEHI